MNREERVGKGEEVGISSFGIAGSRASSFALFISPT